MANGVMLEVRGLTVAFRREGRECAVVRGLDFHVGAGDRVALVGESGCGKSVTCLALTRLPPTDRARVGGSVRFEGRELVGLDARALRAVRGRGLAYVFQDPTGSLNPVMRVGAQVSECVRGPWRQAREQALHLLERVRLPDPAACYRAYPCELSGGMQQRVMLAMALAARPSVLVADEPTTALDVTTQAHVLDLVDELAAADGMAVLLVTHNLGLVAGRSREVHVLYAGRIVECGPVERVLRHPANPYTQGLLASVPRLDRPAGEELRDIPGTVPAPADYAPGCAFAPRCARADARCAAAIPPMHVIGDLDSRHRAWCWYPDGA